MNIVRVFFFAFLLWASSFADVRYTSLHQKASYGSFKEQILHAGSYLSLSSDLPYSSSYRLQCRSGDCIHTQNPHQKQWCGDSFLRYRIYIPPHVKKLTIELGVHYNSSYAGILYFVPDGSPVQSVNFNNFKVMNNTYYPYNYDFPSVDASNHYLFSGYHPLYYSFEDIGKIVFDNLSSYVSNGGWLYIALAQADRIMNSWGGYMPHPELRMVVTYIFDGTNKMQWLKSKKFDSYGDPIENFERLKEIPKSCSGIREVWVRGNHEGKYIFDPDIPDFMASGSRQNRNITFSAKLQAGEKPLFGIAKEENQNITISAKFDDCFQITQAASSKEGGEFFYSKDNSSWISQNEITDLSDIHFVKYEISSPDSSGLVLEPKEAVQIDIKGTAKQNCTKVDAVFKSFYIFKGEEKISSKEVVVALPYQASSSFQSSSSSSVYYYSPQSGFNSSSSDDWCTKNGGHWVDTICEGASSSNQSSSSFQSSSSNIYYHSSQSISNSSSSDDWCTKNGGHWVDTICKGASSSNQSSSFAQSSSFSSSLSSHDSYDRNALSPHAAQIAKKLAGKSFDITGYFVYIGDPVEFEPFEWVYANKSGTFVAKLEGYENGGFKWTRLMSRSKNIHYFDSVKIENGKIVFGGLVEDSPSHAGQIAKKLASKSFDITGYFVYIGDPVEFEPFEWVYANKSGTFVAKLEGYENGGFKWTRLMSNSKNIHYFDSVKIENGKIVFGSLVEDSVSSSSLSDDWCTQSGGHWVDTVCESVSSSQISNASSQSSSSSSAQQTQISTSSRIAAVPHF